MGQVYLKVMLSPNQPLDVTVLRNGKDIEKQIVPLAVTSNQVGSAGWYADESVRVGNREREMRAAIAGIKEGDKVVAVDGKPLPSSDTMIERPQESTDSPVQPTAVPDGKTR